MNLSYNYRIGILGVALPNMSQPTTPEKPEAKKRNPHIIQRLRKQACEEPLVSSRNKAFHTRKRTSLIISISEADLKDIKFLQKIPQEQG